MRARNIKPGFFTNEALTDCQPMARLLFAGLWCMATWDGKLEDRPKKIKGEVFPHDQCDVDAMLRELHSKKLIRRYKVGNKEFIIIPTFQKHQRPHPDEKRRGVSIPDPTEQEDDKEVEKPNNNERNDSVKYPASAPENQATSLEKQSARENNGGLALNADILNADILNADILNADIPKTPLPPLDGELPFAAADFGSSGNTSDTISAPPSEFTAAGLSVQWCFHLTRTKYGRKADEPRDCDPIFQSILDEGIPGEVIDARIRGSPKRDKSEQLWQFKNRILSEFGHSTNGHQPKKRSLRFQS
jgi:hypothetical protein